MWSVPRVDLEFILRPCDKLYALVFLLAVLLSPTAGFSVDYSLSESVLENRLHSVKSTLTVKGQLKVPQSDEKIAELPLNVSAQFEYLERRLSGTGRDAKALRSVRYYKQISAKITVQDRITSANLPDEHRLIVAQGEPNGILFYHPTKPLTYNELELLKTPGDSLPLLGFLPESTVKVGDSWAPESWALQFMTAVDAVEKSELVCTCESVTNEVLKVSLKGSLEGVSLGSKTSFKILGYFLYDLRERFIKKVELTQSEKRPAQGSITPGMDLVATVKWERVLLRESDLLPDKLDSHLLLNPSSEQLRLRFRAPWKIRFEYDRNWHLFHQTEKAAVLRYLDKGNLIAQCNVVPMASATPGMHLSEARFQKYIRESLGEKFKKIESSRVLPVDRNSNIFRYRVEVIGRSEGRPMNWIYYLCADASGLQTAFVFSVETALKKQFQGGDLLLVESLEFVSEKQVAQPASRE